MAADWTFENLDFKDLINAGHLMREARASGGRAVPAEEKQITHGAKEHVARAGRLSFGWRAADSNAPMFEVSRDHQTVAFHWGGRALWSFLYEARQDFTTSLTEAVEALPEHVQESLERFGGAEVFLKTRALQTKFELYAASPFMGMDGPIDFPRVTDGNGMDHLRLKWDVAAKQYTEQRKDPIQEKLEIDHGTLMKDLIKGELAGTAGPITSRDMVQLITAGVWRKEDKLEMPKGHALTPLCAREEPHLVSVFTGFDAHEGKHKLAREGFLQVRADGSASLSTLDTGKADYAWAGSAVSDYHMLTTQLRKDLGDKPLGLIQEDSNVRGGVARGGPWGGMDKVKEARAFHHLLNVLAEDGLVVTASKDLSVANVSYPANAGPDVAGKPLMELYFKDHGVELYAEGAEPKTAVYGNRYFGEALQSAMEIGATAVLRPDMANVAAETQWRAFAKLVEDIEEDLRLQGYAENSPKGAALGRRLMAQGFSAGEKAEVTKEAFAGEHFTGEMPPDARAKLHFWSGEGQKMLKETVEKARSAVEKEVAPARGGESR